MVRTGGSQLQVAQKDKNATSNNRMAATSSACHAAQLTLDGANTTPASSTANRAMQPASHHTSPLLSGSNGTSTSKFAGVESSPGGEQRQKLSPRLTPAAAANTPSALGVNGNITPLSQSAAHPTSNGNCRTRASTSSNLPAYPTASQAALINSLPTSAHLAAQAAAATAAASASAGPSHQYYRSNGLQPGLSTNQASPSSPASSHQLVMQNPFLFPHQLQMHLTYEKHTVELTNGIIAFLSPILPTEEEYRIKEATRRQLERLASRVSPGAKLLAFGSMANGFALRNSDMDLCCLIAGAESDGSDQAKTTANQSASELVEVLGKLIREETDYNVMPLPKARIPIIKISRASTAELPYEISCDIGFENRLALENTRLLLTYAMVDPPRLRTLVLFLKVWTKRRKLNSPYTGTLSSYGYTLMMIFFLTQVKRPAVLPNLQRIPPLSLANRSDNVNLNGHNIYFYDDVATLRKEWSSFNTENVGELLIDFFRYFSKEFTYSKDVISIRTEGGLMTKDGQAWSSELCIEDPFQTGYNVARTVTRDGLYTIRGEFMRASRLLCTRSDRVSQALAELCEEREDGLTRAPDTPYHQRPRTSFASSPSTTQSSSVAAPHYLRDVSRRYEVNNAKAGNGFGGSFAFEEMARGLGQAQTSSNAMAFPPTAAMLAPLSQNTGLSPRQSLMRAGLRYDTPRRGQGGSAMSSGPVSGDSSLVGSSARSEDGSSHYEKVKTRKSSASNNVSARTSPNLDNALPHGFLHPSSAIQAGLGEAMAYGSEISFGSQRFQLHPQTSSARRSDSALAGPDGRQDQQLQRNSRSFSDGLNRSLSLPRPAIETGEKRRSSTPLLSEPASPNNLLVSVGLPDQSSRMFLEPSTVANHATMSASSPRSTSSSFSNNGASLAKGATMRMCSSQPTHASSSNAVTPADKQRLQQASSSLRLPPSPWTFQHPSHIQSAPSPEEEGSFALDDDQTSISDDTLDELARVSALDLCDEEQEQARAALSARRQQSHQLPTDAGKQSAIRSWAASQSAGIHAKEEAGG